MLKMLWALFLRDFSLFMRRRQDMATVLGFFLVAIALFPLGVSPDPEVLKNIAPGAIWIAALFSTILSLDKLFSEDLADGSLEQQMMMPLPLTLVILVRLVAHWAMTGLPLVLLAPIVGFQFGLTFYETSIMALTLILGTPVLVLLGAIAAALTVGLRSSGALITLLLLPLYVPILILASSAITTAIAGDSISAHISLLGAALALAIPLAPYAVVVALKITLD